VRCGGGGGQVMSAAADVFKLRSDHDAGSA
jgi:hypothetical protein